MARYQLLKPFFVKENSELHSTHLERQDLNFVTEESEDFN